jgi:hypothetical protein
MVTNPYSASRLWFIECYMLRRRSALLYVIAKESIRNCCSTDMGRFLGEILVGESLSPRAEIKRAGLLQRVQTHIIQSGGDVTSSPNTPPPYLDMNGPKGKVCRI